MDYFSYIKSAHARYDLKIFKIGLDQNGRVVARRRLLNEHVPSFLEQFSVEKVGLEYSTYIVPLYHALVGRGFRVEVSHPKDALYS